MAAPGSMPRMVTQPTAPDKAFYTTITFLRIPSSGGNRGGNELDRNPPYNQQRVGLRF